MMKQQPKIQPRTKDGKFAKRGEEREIELATAFWIESTAHIKSEPKLDKATFDVFAVIGIIIGVILIVFPVVASMYLTVRI